MKVSRLGVSLRTSGPCVAIRRRASTAWLSRYGCHRVHDPEHGFLQSALRVNPDPRILHPEEALIDVSELLLDSTSMRQFRMMTKTELGTSPELEHAILQVIRARGKCHNPVTNSGGVLTGTLTAAGSQFCSQLEIGSKVCPLGSLTTIPLTVEKIVSIEGDCVKLENSTAVVFSSNVLCAIPDDLGKDLALRCVDISSIVPQVHRTLAPLAERTKHTSAKQPLRVLVIGCGKAGLTTLFVVQDLAEQLGVQIRSVAVDYSRANIESACALRIPNTTIVHCDARNAESMAGMAGPEGFDFAVNVVNIHGTETSTALCVKEGGTVLWFSMATQFDKVALATDVLYKDIVSMVGNGYAINQAELMFGVIRKHEPLRKYFEIH